MQFSRKDSLSIGSINESKSDLILIITYESDRI